MEQCSPMYNIQGRESEFFFFFFFENQEVIGFLLIGKRVKFGQEV